MFLDSKWNLIVRRLVVAVVACQGRRLSKEVVCLVLVGVLARYLSFNLHVTCVVLSFRVQETTVSVSRRVELVG